jgi:hypothetical protein
MAFERRMLGQKIEKIKLLEHKERDPAGVYLHDTHAGDNGGG